MKNHSLLPFLRVGAIPAALIAAEILLEPADIALPFILAAAIHELGHLVAARLLKISLRSLDIGPLGATIRVREGLISYKKEWLLCFAGPLFNLLSAAAVALNLHGEFSRLFCPISVMIALLNLLPLSGFDGGRMLAAAVGYAAGPSVAARTVSLTSFVTVVGLWLFSVYLLIRFGASLSLFVFTASVFYRIFIEKEK